MKQFDVVVIGGGHAGTEAAAAAARMGARTALVTLRADAIGVMSCNPAIGGLGKGHLVREIDAMDGVMGRAADAAGIQFRLLNRRKGPAVQGPRAQADRKLYRLAMQELMARQEGLTVLEAEVTDLIQQGDRIAGVVLADGNQIAARAVILTAGTFLNGVIHIGDVRRPGGRMGDQPSTRLAERLDAMALGRGRLKTGTPPRLDGRTIDWSVLESQPGDDEPVVFSFLNTAPQVRQISCGITHTNERTHDVVRSNLGRSAMYGGHIEGVGPRYCPSIEDKVVRFADKTSHQVFLEPEGLDDPTVYPNGISTSLPAEVQHDYVRSIRGLENVTITQPGYAIEYDFFDPQGLKSTLEVRNAPGLWFAGQINGTTGYEEAAAQGLIAGLNAAAFALGRDPVVFSRTNSYLGVMVDDLISRGVTEPYRMFTSRAEYRLALRADNADQRLTPLAVDLGIVSDARKAAFERKAAAFALGRDPVVFSRTNSYLGVMVDDLISRGVTEPYRMFTSRAEYRLALRADNADQRLTPLAVELGIVSDERKAAFERKAAALAEAKAALEAVRLSPRELVGTPLKVSQDGARRSGYELLAFGEEALAVVEGLYPAFAAMPAAIKAQTAADALYAQYLHRQEADASLLRREEATEVPEGFDYDALSGLSTELKLKLKRQLPANLAQAARIEGMTPAALTLILAHIRKSKRAVASA